MWSPIGRAFSRWTPAVFVFTALAACSGDGATRIDASLIVPAPLRPCNGESTGSVHATPPLRPRFLWKAVPGAVSYQLQVDDSCAVADFASCRFPSPEINEQSLPEPRFDPAQSLPVSVAPPVGRRYFWRVRACHTNGCSLWSAVRYVDVGRLAQDLNGDGYADVIVGTTPSDTPGRTFVYFGGPAPPAAIPDVTLAGTLVGDGFGYAVGAAGDVNGDGFGDLIVGAFTDPSTGAGAGRAFIYLGGETLKTAPDLTVAGAAGDLYGIAVSSAGDVNGDGYADFVVGASGLAAGRAELFFGGAALHAAPDLTLAGEDAGDFFGYPVRPLGDVNGDGFADVGVGASHNGRAGASAGRAYLFLGGAAMNATPDLILDGEAAGDSFGSGLAAGDVDGDGYADFAVGAYLNDAAGTDAGRVYLYRGGPALRAVPDFVAGGGGAGAHLGVNAFVDLNGDGFDDLVVGGAPVGAAGARTFVYYGGASLRAVPDLSIAGADEVIDVEAAGDVDGDGFDDVLIGAPSATLGKVYLHRGGAQPAATPATILTGSIDGDAFGIAVATRDGSSSDRTIKTAARGNSQRPLWRPHQPRIVHRATTAQSSAS